jgi:2,4-diketo-3-deoxy-L-fuconate hydrolase
VTAQTFGFGVVTGDAGRQLMVARNGSLTPLSSLLGDTEAPATIFEMLPEWDTWVARVSQALDADRSVEWSDAADVTMEAPIMPNTVYCAGTNFYDHVKEMKVRLPDKNTEPLVHFNVPAAAVTGHHQLVHRPAGVERLDWEVELAAVISRRAWRVTAEDAMDYVAGYTTANDVSIRDPTIFHDVFGVRWMFSKGQATMKPIGPTLIPRAFVPDETNLALTLHVNGEVRQQSNTSEMIWTLAEQIETYSFMTPLQPGDLLLTGTPAGTAAAYGQYLSDGDEMTASVEGVGTLVNRVAPPFQ